MVTRPKSRQFYIKHLLLWMLVSALFAWLFAPLVREAAAYRLLDVSIRLTVASTICLALLGLQWRSRRRAVRQAVPLRYASIIEWQPGSRWTNWLWCSVFGFLGLLGLCGLLAQFETDNWLQRLWSTILFSAYLSTGVGSLMSVFLWPVDEWLVGDRGVVRGADFLDWRQLEFPQQQPADGFVEVRTADLRVHLLETENESDKAELREFLAARCRLWQQA